MNILAVDSSGNVCSAAVLHDTKILSEVYVDNKKTHSEMLAPMVDDCLVRVGLSIHDIDMFSCAVGPGSFTGLRIGTSMVKAFAHASGKPAIGVNTLDGLAQNMDGADELVCPVIDARRGDVYTATFENGKRITDYRALQLDDVLDELNGQRVVFLGDAAVNYKDKILSASESFGTAHSGVVLQRAGSVGLAAFTLHKNGAIETAYDLEPFYLRETQAERVYAMKHANKG